VVCSFGSEVELFPDPHDFHRKRPRFDSWRSRFSLTASVFGLIAQFGLSAEAAQQFTSPDHLSLAFDAVNYLYLPTDSREPVFESFGLKGRKSSESAVLEARVDGELKLILTPQVHTYFEVTEAFLSTSSALSERTRFRAGRKLENWSQLDQDWQLGIWQPRFRWDYLHPDPVGLTGFFVEIADSNTRGLELVAFGSPIFIPERGVPITVFNGTLTSPSAWFTPPTSKLDIFGEETPLRYTLDVPPLSEIVLNPSLAFMVRTNSAALASSGLWASAAYGYKPMNQLLLAHNGRNLYMPTYDIPVTIRPRVTYHHLASIEGGLVAKPASVTVSLMHDRPVKQNLPPGWTYQVAAPAWAGSISLSTEVSKKRDPALLELNYLQRLGGNAPDQGLFADGTNSSFEARYPFTSAVSLGAKSNLAFLGGQGYRIHGSFRTLYEFTENGTICSTDFKYDLKDHWTLRFGADLLATDVFGSSDTRNNHFIARYQVNNRIEAGVVHAF